MDQEQVLQILARAGAIKINDHFELTSGRHSSAYVDKYALYPDTAQTVFICNLIGDLFAEEDIEVVIGPATGGVVLSHCVAKHLAEINRRKVRSLFTQSGYGKEQTLMKSYRELVNGKGVMVVDDIITTGGTVHSTVETVRSYGGKVLGVGVICNRGGVSAADVGNVPKLAALLDFPIETWPANDCPLCKSGVPINISIA